MSVPRKLDGKVVLITGTGGGQGRAAALLFAREGATVIGCDVDAGSARETTALAQAEGLSLESHEPVDLSEPEQARDWVEQAGRRSGRIDVLYNNGGAATWKWVEDLGPEDWQYSMRNMLNLVYYTCHYAWPYLIASGSGVIINSAMAGATTQALEAHPSAAGRAAKAGVIAMTRQLAAEGAPHGIRANSLSPGAILVPLNARVYEDPKLRSRMTNSLALRRLGQPEDMAAAALFLASSASSYVTAADLPVDGGISSVRAEDRFEKHV